MRPRPGRAGAGGDPVSAAITLGDAVTALARWLGRRGVSACVLPPRALPRPARYVPHIYTGQELAALFAQTDRCRYCSQVPFRHLVMPVLFRVIYACGLFSGGENRDKWDVFTEHPGRAM